MAELVVSAGSKFNTTPQEGVGNRIRQQADEVGNLESHEGLSYHFSPHTSITFGGRSCAGL